MKYRNMKLALACLMILCLCVCFAVLCAVGSQSLLLFGIVTVLLHLIVCGTILYFTYGVPTSKM